MTVFLPGWMATSSRGCSIRPFTLLPYTEREVINVMTKKMDCITFSQERTAVDTLIQIYRVAYQCFVHKNFIGLQQICPAYDDLFKNMVLVELLVKL